MTTASDIVARIDRLPPSRPVWTLIVLISLGACFEFYDLMMTAYISPVLAEKLGLSAERVAALKAAGVV